MNQIYFTHFEKKSFMLSITSSKFEENLTINPAITITITMIIKNPTI